MRLLSTSKCIEGMKLAKAIYSEEGQILLQQGISLTPRMILRLQEIGIPMIYIEDERTKDIEAKDPIGEQTKNFAMKTIRQQFTKLVKDGRLDFPKDDYEIIKSFRTTIHMIIDDLMKHQGTISALVNMNSYDQYTFSHSLHVTVYSLALAIAKEYSEKQLIEIGMGALLHDIGKLAIPQEILKKADKLTPEEFELMKEHPTIGFNLLKSLHEVPLLSAHCAFQHHERIDGAGYPRGIQDKNIHEYARIIAICDVFDALTSNRIYQEAITPHMAVEVLYIGAGKQFDYDLVVLFKNIVCMYPIGMTVRLSNGYLGIVVDHNRYQPGRPIVRLLRDKNGVELENIEEIDLTKNLSILIEGCE